MTTLPQPPSHRSLEFELPSVSFFGRSLAEYLRFFSLDLPAWRGRGVLDVAAGPASFTAEACAQGIDAVAVDPLYGCTPDALAAHVLIDYAKVVAQMRAKPGLFRVGPDALAAKNPAMVPLRAPCSPAGFFVSLSAAEADRRAAARRFLADYDLHFVHNRYVGGALPRLPFADRAFPLVLCAHLLFIHAARFDFDWHLAACRELARVAGTEARIHPVCGPDGRPYPALARLRQALAGEGIASEVARVDYEFFAGSDSMLVLRRPA